MDRREADILGRVLGRTVDRAEPGCAESDRIPPGYLAALGRCPGIVLVDKPAGRTSHDVIDRIRSHLRKRMGKGAPRRGPKTGHSGTLDPAATGLLLVGLGLGTKLLPYLHGLGKSYRATVRLGVRTETDDLEGEIVGDVIDDPAVSPEALEQALGRFRGEFRQAAPRYSAIKRGGRPDYSRARAGEDFEPAVRQVEISRLELARFDGREAVLELDCSAGTYVRSLARDIGEVLAVGGTLAALRRTAIGPFSLEHALGLDELGTIALAET